MEARLTRLVREAGGRCLKFIPDNAAGMPDRLVLFPGGASCWVELKRPKGGRLSPLQKVQHKSLTRLGQRVAVVWTGEQAEALVRALTGAPTRE